MHSTPPRFLGLEKRFPEQDKFVVGVLRRAGKLLGIRVTSLVDLTHQAANQGFRGSGERAWIARYLAETANGPRSDWLKDAVPPKKLMLSVSQLRSRRVGLVSLYLRRKGLTEGDQARWHSLGRDGSSPIEYDSLIRTFNSAGYSVLVTGDYGAEDFPRLDRKGLDVFFSDDLGLDSALWNLWVPILADGCIGNAGGGMTLAQIARQKSLVIDAYGYWFGMNNAIIHFRTSPRETSASFREKFAVSPHIEPRYDVRKLSRTSSSELVTLANEFLDFLGSSSPLELPEEISSALFTDEHWLKFCSNWSLSSLNRKILARVPGASRSI